MSSVQVKLNLLDSLEILSFNNHQTEHPVHYHDTYCLSIIEEGVFSENELIAPKGSIVISHPHEIHENRLVENIGVSFTTFYISPDLINYISGFAQTSFRDKIIEDQDLWFQLNELKQLVGTRRLKKMNTPDFYTSFYQIVQYLTNRYGHDQTFIQNESSVLLNEVKQHIGSNLNAKFNLNKLATLVGMSKYQFTRWFKKRVGLTPFEYILLKRVGLGKKLIQRGVPLVDVSLDSGFYDQSHFSNYFKRYVGLSPKAYSRNCNIFQDF